MSKTPFVNLTDVTLADKETNLILTDKVNRVIQGNVAMQVTQPGGQPSNFGSDVLGLFYPNLKKFLKSWSVILRGVPCSQSVRQKCLKNSYFDGHNSGSPDFGEG